MTPIPEAPPGPTAGQNMLARKIAWVLLAATVSAPPLLLVGFFTRAYALDDFDWPWFIRHPGVLALTAVLTGSLTVLGMWRGWHKRISLFSGWSIGAATVLALAGLAIMGIHNLNRQAIDKEVLCHIPQLAAAADQYFLENGVSIVSYANLVGATNYVKALNPVAHESYPAYYTQGMTITVTGVAGLRTITYAP